MAPADLKLVPAPGVDRFHRLATPVLFLLTTLALVALMNLVGGVQAGSNEPQWSKSTAGDVVTTDMSDDGRYLALGNLGGEVLLYDMDSPSSPIIDYTASDEVLDVALTPDGQYLVAGSLDHSVYLFDRDRPLTPIYTYDTTLIVSNVDIDDDGVIFVAVTGDDSTNYLYFFENGGADNPYRSQTIYNKGNEVAISGDGAYAGVAEEGDFQYFSTEEGSSGHLWYQSFSTYDSVDGVDISTDGDRVAVIVSNGNIYMYNRTGGVVWSANTYGESSGYLAVATTPNGGYTVAGDKDGVIYQYGVDGEDLFNYTCDGRVMDVAISNDGKRFAVGSMDEKVYHFYPDESALAHWFYNANNKVQSVSISGDGEWTAAGSWNDYVYYFDAEGVANVKPEADITSIGPGLGALVGETVQFKGDSDDPDGGEIIEYEWRSDLDGVLSDQEDFNSDGLSQGEHTVSFRVRDDAGDWSDPDTATYIIHTAPTAQIEDISPSPAFEGDEVTFEADADDDREVARYIWSSNLDGEFYNGSSATCEYDGLSLGSHDIIMVVWDDLDVASDTDLKRLDVREPSNQKPTAQIDSITPVGAYASDTVTFRGTGSDPDGEIRAHEWKSSIEGILGFSAKVDYPLSEGTHTITYRVQDDDSEWSELAQQSFTVRERLVAVLSIAPDTGTTDNTFNFRATNSLGDPTQYKWDLGDGTIIDWGTAASVSHQYDTADTYDVQLWIRDANQREADAPATRTLLVSEPDPNQPNDPGNTDLSDDSPAPELPLLLGVLAGLVLVLRRGNGN